MKFFFFFFPLFAVSLLSTPNETLKKINGILLAEFNNLPQTNIDDMDEDDSRNKHLPLIQKTLKEALGLLNSTALEDDKNRYLLVIKKTFEKISGYLEFIAAVENEADTIHFQASLASFHTSFYLLFISYAYFYSERDVTCDVQGLTCEENLQSAFKIPAPLFACSIIIGVKAIINALRNTDENYKQWQCYEWPSFLELIKLRNYLLENNQSRIAEYISFALTMNQVKNEEAPELLRSVFFGVPEQRTWAERFIKHFWRRLY